jgi:CheY-like chemotaxis protein
LHLVKEKSFDLIFLDVLMPGMDGFTLCSRIRETPLNQHTPVIFVTSCVDLKARTQSELSGATELLGKPFLPIEITVKAITFTMRSRLQKKRTQQVKEPEVSEPIRTESAKPQAAGQGDTVRTDKRARRAARRARERTRVSPWLFSGTGDSADQKLNYSARSGLFTV